MIANNKTPQLATPVLLIAFNRPDTAMKVFECIRKVRPTHFYLAVDGARQNKKGEDELCRQCQQIANLVDWECEVHTLFRDQNVGCGKGPSSAITWAFETTDKLIVLEDDCLPSFSFFTFCESLLQKYEDDKRVWIISGLSIHPNSAFFAGKDYLFSRYAHTWGWATWRNRWSEFDLYMKDFPEFIAAGGARTVISSRMVAKRVNRRLTQVYNSIDTEVLHSWDTQWDYVRLKNNSCDIVPRVNLICNVGALNGTHISIGGTGNGLSLSEFDSELKSPLFVVRNEEYDKFHYRTHVHPSKFKLLIAAVVDRNKRKYLFDVLVSKLSRR